MKNEKRVNLKTEDWWRQRLHRVAAVVGKSSSEFIREAVDQRINRLAARNPEVANVLEDGKAA